MPRNHHFQPTIHVLDSDRLSPTEQEMTALARIAKLDDVVQVVALPDLHYKPKLETPSSTAVATRNSIMLGLSSPSPNCSMALARTSLFLNDLNDDRLDALFADLAQRLPLQPQNRTLSLSEMSDVMLKGGAAAVERYQLDPSTLQYMDQQGNAIPPENANIEQVMEAVPRVLQELGGRRFALIGKGNHFLELQVVDDVLDEKVAASWGISQGQLVVMYHADSGYLGAFLGRLYAHRKKNTWQGRLLEWKFKLPFHLTTGRPGRLPYRTYYHLLPHRLRSIPVDSEEGQRALLALQAASNYAYANRLAVLTALREALCTIWGKNLAPTALLWDAPHNTIRQETIAEQELWVHRHNATRVVPPSAMPAGSPFADTGQPVLLPGLERTSSYLCVAGEGAAYTLHSADHGSGRSAIQLGQSLNENTTTRLYTYSRGLAQMVSHLSDDGIEEVLAILHMHNIARPVARLRPIAVLKEPK